MGSEVLITEPMCTQSTLRTPRVRERANVLDGQINVVSSITKGTLVNVEENIVMSDKPGDSPKNPSS